MITGKRMGTIAIPFVLTLILQACGNSQAKESNLQGKPMQLKDSIKNEQKKEQTESVVELISDTTNRSNASWASFQFFDLGKLVVPSGNGWKGDGQSFFNRNNGCVIIVQNQAGDFTNQLEDYLESYNDVNKAEAPGYIRTGQKLGKINGITAAQVTGKFNNGVKMVTKDYWFFTSKGAYLLQGRIPENNKAFLDTTMDAVASSLNKN